MRMPRWFPVLLALLVLLAPSLTAVAQDSPPAPVETPEAAAPDENSTQTPETFPNADLLVTIDWLNDHLDEPGLTIIDMRLREDYEQGHVPGAVNLPLGRIIATVNGIAFELDVERVQSALGSIGLSPDDTAVIYDDLGMMNSARLFWTLEYLGHDDVRIVDGGWNAWTAADYPVSDTVPEVERSEYPADIRSELLVTVDEVLENLDNPDVLLVDARAPEEYTGETSFSRRAGHIPGAVNFVWLDALVDGTAVYATDPDWQDELRDPDVERFKSPGEIEMLLEAAGITRDRTIITYCQTLWRGAHVYFLLRLMGYEDVRGYDGSWAEWGNRDDLPIVTGNDPGTLQDAQPAP